MPRKRKVVVEKDKENEENVPLADYEPREAAKRPIKARARGKSVKILRDSVENKKFAKEVKKEVKKEIEEDVIESTSGTDNSSSCEDIKPDICMTIVPIHQIDYCEKIRNQPFVGSNWPKVINTHEKRRFLEITQENPKLNAGEAKFLSESKDHCIICGVQDFQSELLVCQGHMNGLIGSGKLKLPCESRFHLDCIMKYNASDYCLTYIVQKECQNEILCPLHFCDTCFFERKKQTAFIGKLIECSICLRSFHYDKCAPIGCKDLELTLRTNNCNYKIEMVICPAHRPPKDIKMAHLPCCCECETDKPGVPLVSCRICIRSFHAECRTAQTIDGKAAPADLCEFCLTGECVRIDSPVIARWTDNKFYPAVTREWRKCPNKLRRAATYDQLGYCTVEWKGESSSQFSIIAIADCVPMFESSVRFLGSKMKAPFLKAWRELIEQSEEFKLGEPLYKEVRRKIDTSKYFGKDAERMHLEPEKYICDCPVDDEDHCNTETCSNRREYYECPPECNNNKKICHNRGISDKKVNPKCERRKTDHKGFGVFANGLIKNGEFIAEYAGEIINKLEIERRNNLIANARDNEANLYMMALGNGRAVDATRAGNIARYINHSCDPNCQTVKRICFMKERRNEALYDYRIAIVAIKDIDVGEELTFKYMMDDVELRNTVTPKCRCGAKKCAGNLGGDVRDESDEEEEIEEVPVVVKKVVKKTVEKKKKVGKKTEEKNQVEKKKLSEEEPIEVEKGKKRKMDVKRKNRKRYKKDALFEKFEDQNSALTWLAEKIKEDLTPKMALVPVNPMQMLLDQNVSSSSSHSLQIVEIESNDDEEVGSSQRRSGRLQSTPSAINYFPSSRRSVGSKKTPSGSETSVAVNDSE